MVNYFNARINKVPNKLLDINNQFTHIVTIIEAIELRSIVYNQLYV